MCAVGPRRLDLLDPRTSRRPQSDLENLPDVLHFRCAPDRARQAIGHPVEVVAPIEMLVDMDERDRPAPLESPQDGDRNRVVAAQHDWQRAGLEDLAYRLLGSGQMALEIMDVGPHVAAIDRPDIAAVVKWSAKIEVVALQAAHDAVARPPHRRWHAALVVGDVLERVGRAIRDAEECNVGLERIEIEREFGEQERRKSPAGRHGQGGRHAFGPLSLEAHGRTGSCASRG